MVLLVSELPLYGHCAEGGLLFTERVEARALNAGLSAIPSQDGGDGHAATVVTVECSTDALSGAPKTG